MMPTIDRAKEPKERMPFSNSGPRPIRLPKNPVQSAQNGKGCHNGNEYFMETWSTSI